MVVCLAEFNVHAAHTVALCVFSAYSCLRTAYTHTDSQNQNLVVEGESINLNFSNSNEFMYLLEMFGVRRR